MTPETGQLVLDAEALYRELLRGVRGLCGPATRLVGITSGGAWLAERLGAHPRLFAYPNGKSEDMTDGVVRAVEHAGFRAAFTAEFAAARTSDDPYKIPRVTAYADTKGALRLQIERSFYAR